MARIVQLEQRTEVDYETGEVNKQVTSRVLTLPQEPPYVKMYIEDVGKLLDVSAGPRAVLYQLARRVDYEGYISLSSGARKRVAAACEIDVRTLNNYLTLLKKSGVIRATETSDLELNPHLFAKGDWKDIARRRQDFELTIRYNADGSKTFKSKKNSSRKSQIDIEDYLEETGNN